MARMPIRSRFAWRTVAILVVVVAATATRAIAASVDGIPLHWTSAGAGPQTLMLVHGWTCDDSSWSGQVPALMRKYRILTLDLPGHGKSGKIEASKFSMDLFARAVEAVRAEAGAERLVLVGHSMGTPVIRQYARLYPQHVAALVLVDGVVALGAPPPPGAQPAQRPVPERMRGPEGPKNRETMIRSMFTPATPKPLQDHVLKMMLGAPEATAYGAMVATFDPKIWGNDVMAVPTLGLFADKSALGNEQVTKKLFPKYEHHEIPGTGHFLMMEKPREFNALLAAFVDTLPTAAR
jgi:sigma-B regulation protein RsbQ